MSGMTIIADGDQLDLLRVSYVKRNTPAYNAGLREGQQILKMNGRNLNNSNISEIQMLLRKTGGYESAGCY